MNEGVRLRETVCGKVLSEIGEGLAVDAMVRRGVGNEHGLMVLRAAREERGDKGDAEAAALITEKIGEAGGFVVFVFGDVGVGELADGNE